MMSQRSSSAQQNYMRNSQSYYSSNKAGGTYLPTRNAGTEWVVADANFFVRNGIGKVVLAARHRADEDGDGMRLGELRKVRA